MMVWQVRVVEERDLRATLNSLRYPILFSSKSFVSVES